MAEHGPELGRLGFALFLKGRAIGGGLGAAGMNLDAVGVMDAIDLPPGKWTPGYAA